MTMKYLDAACDCVKRLCAHLQEGSMAAKKKAAKAAVAKKPAKKGKKK